MSSRVCGGPRRARPATKCAGSIAYEEAYPTGLIDRPDALPRLTIEVEEIVQDGRPGFRFSTIGARPWMTPEQVREMTEALGLLIPVRPLPRWGR